jgi:parvulin-like peptidyl-prolyl isomerase
MKIKQLLAIMLCAALIFASIAGCSNDDDDVNGEHSDYLHGDTEHSPGHADSHVHGINFERAIHAFAPDTVMIRSGDFYITWADLYVFLYPSVSSLLQFFPTGIDWSDVLYGETSLAEMVLEQATEEALSFLIYEHAALVLGVTFDDESMASLNADIDELVDMYGSKEDLEIALRERGGIYSFEVFERLIKIEFTMALIMEDLYGVDADSFPDEPTSEYAQRSGYMRAKHILRMKTEESDYAPVQEIEDILDLLNEYEGDDFEGFFDELMREHSQDPGSTMHPDGYVFQFNDMVSAFSEASTELDFGEISGIVETEYGYHIILRLPLDYDSVPFAAASAGMHRTIRQFAAIEDFEEKRQVWRDELNVEFTPEYHAIDIAVIFAECDH